MCQVITKFLGYWLRCREISAELRAIDEQYGLEDEGELAEVIPLQQTVYPANHVDDQDAERQKQRRCLKPKLYVLPGDIAIQDDGTRQ